MAQLRQPLVRPGLAATRSPTRSTRTGIGWRTDIADVDISQYDNPCDVFWDTQYKDNLAILDDWHTAMAMVLLRNGSTTSTPPRSHDLDELREALLDLRSTMQPKVTIPMYTDMPPGPVRALAQFWSGDAINMPVLPAQEDPASSVLRYWFPPDGDGRVDNDLVVCLGRATTRWRPTTS